MTENTIDYRCEDGRSRAVALVILRFHEPRSQFTSFKSKIVHGRRDAIITPDHILLDSAPNVGPLISRWELDRFKNCWKKKKNL
jgi:hypothetical protein